MLLTEDQEQIRDTVRAFAQEQLWPNAARWDQQRHFPKEAHQGLAALGAYGICVPEELGGANLDFSQRTFKLTYSRNFGSNKVKSARQRETGADTDGKRVKG